VNFVPWLTKLKSSVVEFPDIVSIRILHHARQAMIVAIVGLLEAMFLYGLYHVVDDSPSFSLGQLTMMMMMMMVEIG